MRVPIGGELASAPRSFRSNLVFGRSRGIGTMMQHAHRRQSSERRAHSTAAAPGPWAEAGHRHLGSSSALLRPGAGPAPNRCLLALSLRSSRAGGRPVAPCRSSPTPNSATSSLRASATIMVFLVVPRPSCVRCRNHWTRALSGRRRRKRQASWSSARGPSAHGLDPWGTRALPASVLCQGQAWRALFRVVGCRSRRVRQWRRRNAPPPGDPANCATRPHAPAVPRSRCRRP